MPHVNAKGHIAHGKIGWGAFLDNVSFDVDGGTPRWYDDHTLVYVHSDDDETYLASYDTTTHAITRLTTPDIPSTTGLFLFGSRHGHWVATHPAMGIFSSASVGLIFPDATCFGVGPEGSVAYASGHDPTTLRIREITGNDYGLSSKIDISIYNDHKIDIVNRGQMIWQELSGGAGTVSVLKTYGLPSVVVIGTNHTTPQALLIEGVWWITYRSATNGPVIHPINATRGFLLPGNGGFDVAVLEGKPTTVRFAWQINDEEALGGAPYIDIDVKNTPPTVNFGPGGTIPGVPPPPPPTTTPGAGGTGGGAGGTGGGSGSAGVGGHAMASLTSTGTFDVVGAPEELITLPIEVFPSYPHESGKGRIIHPILGAFDYEVKPDEWVNIDADAIIPPVWASSRTLTSAANVLWMGNLRDVVVEERWKALGGLAMPITQLRMLLAIWTTPIDPDIGYVHWYPNYITGVKFKVLPINLTAGGQGIAFDDVVNYKDEFGESIGWVTSPVTFQLKLVERL